MCVYSFTRDLARQRRKAAKSTVPECLRSFVMLSSDEEEEAYELCPLLAEREN